MTHLDAPSQDHQWLRKLLPGQLQPLIRGIRKRIHRRGLKLPEPFRTVFPFTQALMVRQENLLRLAGILEREKVLGAVVECGVLDGGTAALMAYGTAGSGRSVHLFDAWMGLPESSPEDGEGSRKWVGDVVGSQIRVDRVMKLLKIESTRLNYHAGWFHETFPTSDIPNIALLHIDCDFYDPTKLCLSTWYDKVSPGGFVQIDDYGSFIGSTKAVDEFLVQHPELKLEAVQSMHGAAYYFCKPLPPEGI